MAGTARQGMGWPASEWPLGGFTRRQPGRDSPLRGVTVVCVTLPWRHEDPARYVEELDHCVLVCVAYIRYDDDCLLPRLPTYHKTGNRSAWVA